MKKIFCPILTLFLTIILCMSACDKEPGYVPGGTYSDDNPMGLSPKVLESAIEAFDFGRDYFENHAKFYETMHIGNARPQGMGGIFAGDQKVYTRKYLSQNGDYMYDSANYSKGPIDVSFSFLAAQKADGDMHFKKFKGDKHIDTQSDNPSSDYSEYNLSSLEATTNQALVDTCGFNPKEFVSYIINKDTIESQEFVRGGADDQYAYKFKFVLNSAAHGNYKNQVEYFSGYDYKSFNHLTLEFESDKYGRVRKITTTEQYTVSALGGQSTKVDGVQIINYGKNPIINFDGFTVSLQEVAG